MSDGLLELIQDLAEMPVNHPDYEEKYLELKDILAHNIVHIEFVKANGDYRLLDCTNNYIYINSRTTNKPPKTKTAEENEAMIIRDMNNRLIRSFDIEKNDFRSFKFETVAKAYITDMPLN